MKKAVLTLTVLTTATMMLAGCASSQPASPTGTTSVPSSEKKVGDTTKTGAISKAGESFFLQEPGKQPVQLDSYSVDLGSYVGQTVTVTGQYSGDTLFVSKVE